MLAGDRRTLRSRALWDHWSVDLRALEAALLDGDTARAGALARRYADFDPRDEDLRVAVAAMLCLAGDAARGGKLLETVQGDRAHQRHEAWARNWGEVRAAIVACAAKAGLPAPPRAGAGRGGRGRSAGGARGAAAAALRGARRGGHAGEAGGRAPT